MSHTIENMRAHIERLVAEHDILCCFDVARDDAWGAVEIWEIHIPHVDCELAYATALHEIGHLLGPQRLSSLVLVRERDAWDWARANALCWSENIDRDAAECLEWYEQQIALGDMSPEIEPAVMVVTDGAGNLKER